jgi:hypothetical protein
METVSPQIADQNDDFREPSATALSSIWPNLGDKPGGSDPIQLGVFKPHTWLGGNLKDDVRDWARTGHLSARVSRRRGIA